MNNLEPTKNTVEAIRRWEMAHELLNRAKSQLSSAEAELMNATIGIGKWLTPEDAKAGETFNVWVADGIISVEVKGEGRSDFRVWWRKPAKSNRFISSSGQGFDPKHIPTSP